MTKAPGFEMVEVLCVIRDADDDSEGAFRSAVGALAKANLDAPERPAMLTDGNPRVGVYVIPGSGESGGRETLFLKSYSANPNLSCVDSFHECVASNGAGPTHAEKARAQALLASFPEYVENLGIAARKGLWDMMSSALEDLRAFLGAMSS